MDDVETWTLQELLPTEQQRKYPLQSLAATERGRLSFAVLLAEVQRKTRVACQGCKWRGYRHGGFVCAADKPCPRCGSSVAVVDAVAYRAPNTTEDREP